jgi:multimeric flavodoxin WrbA
VADVLVVYQSRSGGTQALCDSVIAGVREAGSEPRVLHCFDAGIDDVRWCGGILLGTPTHFGYMSGALKDFFERIFRPLLDETIGKPWGMFTKGESDVDGCVTSVERIVTGLRWKAILPPVKVVGDVGDDGLAAAFELGATMAAGLDEGLF